MSNSPASLKQRKAANDLMPDYSDLSFFVLPAPHLVSLAPILASTARLAGSLVHDFEGSFAYIKGFDVYTLQVGPYLALPILTQHTDR